MSTNNQSSGKKSLSPGTVKFFKFIASMGGRIVLTCVFAIILLAIVYAMLESGNDVLFAILAVCCGFFGWQSLNRITPNIFVWMPIGGWILYYVIKAMLSIIIGVFIAPIWIGKKISSAVMDYIDEMYLS